MYKYQAVVFENDIENLFANVLPRVPETCRYLLLKRPDETQKPDDFKINIKRIKQILNFYIKTNREQKRLVDEGKLTFCVDLNNEDGNDDAFAKQIDENGYLKVPEQLMDEEQMDKDKAQEQVHKADIGDEIEEHSVDEDKPTN